MELRDDNGFKEIYS